MCLFIYKFDCLLLDHDLGYLFDTKKMLSKDLRERIIESYEELGSYRDVARKFKVSHPTVRKYVLGLHKAEPDRRGPKPKISRRQESRMNRAINGMESREERVTARKVQQECELQHVSTRTVRRKLRSMDFSFGKAQKRIVLTEQHKKDRLAFARSCLTAGTDWTKVIFTDEKRFNADGPDSWSSWMRNGHRKVRNRRQQGGVSLQVWGMLMPGPLLTVIELPPRGDSADFMNFFENRVLPNICNQFCDDFILQQDNASVHVSRESLRKFDELNVRRLNWPARSPDLNIIENCWSMIAHEVYDGRQFNSKEDLWHAIDRTVSKLNTDGREKLQHLFESIPRRFLECVDLKGDLTHY